MKVVKKLLAPVLVVGLLLTSLVTLHHLKDAKKDNVFRIGISSTSPISRSMQHVKALSKS